MSTQQLQTQLDTFWLLANAIFVFAMQAGFTLLEMGTCRAKNAANILLKNFSVLLIVPIGWYLLGFGFAFGKGSNGFIGTSNFALYETTDLAYWVFQYMFCAAAITIPSGAMAERTSWYSYMVWVFLASIWIYPVPAHWIWASNGWMSPFRATVGKSTLFDGGGLLDFAGSGVVHICGGFAALTGTFFLGPRMNRFDVDEDGKVLGIPSQSLPLMGVGVMFLQFGWFAFNAGSSIGLSGSLYHSAQYAFVNSILSGAVGGAIGFLGSWIEYRSFSIICMMNGLLGGMVAVTGPSGYIEPWAAIIAGFFAGWTVLFFSWVLKKLRIDDPVDAFPVHGMCGILGLLISGLFASKPRVADVLYNGNEDAIEGYGLFMGGGGRSLAASLVAILILPLWSMLWSSLIWIVMKLCGILRVSEVAERKGIDVGAHGMIEWSRFAADTIYDPFMPPPILALPPHVLAAINRLAADEERRAAAGDMTASHLGSIDNVPPAVGSDVGKSDVDQSAADYAQAAREMKELERSSTRKRRGGDDEF